MQCWPRFFTICIFALLAFVFLWLHMGDVYGCMSSSSWERRSCCNLYAKLFYKLSKKDGVSRMHTTYTDSNYCCTNSHSKRTERKGNEKKRNETKRNGGKQAPCRTSSSLGTLTIKNSHTTLASRLFFFSQIYPVSERMMYDGVWEAGASICVDGFRENHKR